MPVKQKRAEHQRQMVHGILSGNLVLGSEIVLRLGTVHA